MSAFLASPAAYPYRPGFLFLGLDPDTNAPLGINTERHAITVAGARSGKGAAFLIPNALRWPGSLLCVDPKGENADETAEKRAAMGQRVGVLDPYGTSHVADALRCSINPLSLVKLDDPRARLDLESIADGFIRRFDPKHQQWDNAGTRIGAGLMAYVLETAPPDYRTMAAVRALMVQPDDAIRATAAAMLETSGFGGLARSAALSILRALDSSDSVEAGGFSRLKEETSWMDDEYMAAVLSGPNPFPLETLKAGTGSLFLVIPGDAIEQRSGFLRLFVRIALMVMARSLAPRDGSGHCLFLLDEFFSLGRLDLLATASGQMPGYGVHLWPFLQDVGQVQTLYGDKLAETFFANADAAIFFGNSDQRTLEYVSRWIGNLKPEEVVETAPMQKAYSSWNDRRLSETEAETRERLAIEHNNRRAEYDHTMRIAGKPRLTPEEVAVTVGKKAGDKVARAALVFAQGGDVLKVRLQPHFEPAPAQRPAAPLAPAAAVSANRQMLRRVTFALCLGSIVAGAGMVSNHIPTLEQGMIALGFCSFAVWCIGVPKWWTTP